MDREWAMEHLSGGTKLHHESWDAEQYIQIVKERLMCNLLDNKGNRASMTALTLHRDGWSLFEEPKKTLSDYIRDEEKNCAVIGINPVRQFIKEIKIKLCLSHDGRDKIDELAGERFK